MHVCKYLYGGVRIEVGNLISYPSAVLESDGDLEIFQYTLDLYPHKILNFLNFADLENEVIALIHISNSSTSSIKGG